MLGLIAVGVTTLYETVALFAGDHWSLEEHETIAFTNAIDAALDTLPGDVYAIVRKLLEKYWPWLTLSIVASKITIPRWQESLRRGKPQPYKTSSAEASRADSQQPGNPTNGAGGYDWNNYRAESSFRSGLN